VADERPLQGRRALVTGASRGIGAAIARALAHAGADLVLAARSEGDLRAVAETCRGDGVRADVVPTNARDAPELERLAARAGDVDILVNNAGLGHSAPIHELRLEQWDEMFDVNVRAMFYLTHLVAPRMMEARAGDIVNVGSTGAIRGYARGVGYNATKFAVRGFCEALQKDLRPFGIRVLLVNPGLVDTEFFQGQPIRPDMSVYLRSEDVASAVLHGLTVPRHAGIRELNLVAMEQDW
jgi:NADP-dependent 3-hydroxy acid dehydrogenase YdfG